jgi:hypothetical protein
MRRNHSGPIALLLAGCFAFGCSTKLIVRSIEAGDAQDARAASPKGVVVNRLTSYSAKVTSSLPISAQEKRVSLVDPHRLLEVDYCRLPFANGKLTLELTKNAQTLLKAGVTGTTPVTNVVKAADSGVSTAAKLQELSAESDAAP